MKSRFSIASFSVVIGLCIFFACKKQDQNPATNDPELFNSAVQKWKVKFIETASPAEARFTQGFTERLDFTNSLKIALGDSGVLFVIGIKGNEKLEKGCYLGIALKKGNYSFDGIYEASGIEEIRNIYSSHSLRANDSILVRGIDHLPVKEWQSDARAKVMYRVVRPHSGSEYPGTNKSVNTPHAKTTSVAGSNCTDMWWWEIDENTGEWVPKYFLYQLCDKPDDPNDSGSMGYFSITALLCQTYSFTTVGNSYATSITNLAYAYSFGSTNLNLTILFPNSCLQIPSYSMTAATAGAAFNTAFNAVAYLVQTQLNSGVIQPMAAKATFKTLLQTTLSNTIPGASWSTANCSGTGIPTTTINYNSFCP